MKSIICILTIIASACKLNAQELIPIWPQGETPNVKGLALKDSIVNERAYRVMLPVMYGFYPSKDDNNGAAVLIFPGGGYDHITYVWAVFN